MRILTKLITGEEFDNLFRTFEHTVFRLETRDRYNAPYEAEMIRTYEAGEPATSLPGDRPWTNNVRTTTAAGLKWSRVRVVSEPLTDYSQFGLWACQRNINAGDNIRYLPRSQAEELDLPKLPYDYWLFDSRKLILMHYNDDDDRFEGAELIEDPTKIVQHNYWRDVAKHHSIARDDFAAKHGASAEV